MTNTFDKLPKIGKILLQLFFGWVGSGLYRVLKFFETKNIMTLIMGLLGLFTGLGNVIFWWIDLFTIIFHDKIHVFAE